MKADERKPADHDPLIFYTDDAPAWKVVGFWISVGALLYGAAKLAMYLGSLR